MILHCECGAKFKVSDELAGRRGKCPHCGAVLNIGAPVACPPTIAAAPRTPARAPDADKKCGQCGAVASPSARFCGHCGASLVPQEEPLPVLAVAQPTEPAEVSTSQAVAAPQPVAQPGPPRWVPGRTEAQKVGAFQRTAMGCLAAFGGVFGGLLVMLIPVIGWIIGLIMIGGAIVCMIEHLKGKWEGLCPVCGKDILIGNSGECDGCKQRIVRQGQTFVAVETLLGRQP